MNEPSTSVVQVQDGYRPRAVSVAEAPGESGSLMGAIARAAADPRTDLDKMQRLFEMREKLIEREAEMQFIEAMARFKENCPIVHKDMRNKQYESNYTSIGNLVNTINPALGKYGLSADWVLEQGEKIKITCVLSHVGGHKKRVSLSAGPDTSGAKNPIQQIKSTITYLELITFQAATGIATHGANEDDDGNRTIKDSATITAEQVARLITVGAEVGADKDKFLRMIKVKSLEEIPSTSYDMVLALLEAKRKR